ncbi:MAG: hypothetical protein GIW95_06665 [Candidatus Eremiobacteraeota bacterium]|nr:hypothetical protein [Candidatus Eremiobacteraeota bacterium]
MNRFLGAALSLAFLIGLSGVADAKSCRDAKGKFVKCKTSVTTPAKKPCRDAKGKFIKCK